MKALNWIGQLASIGILLALLDSAPLVADAPITAVAVTPGGHQILFGSQQGIEIRSLPEMNVVESLDTELVHVNDLAFSPDGSRLLAAGGTPAEKGLVEIWDWPNRERVQSRGDHTDVVYHVAWSPDGSRWVSCGADSLCFVNSLNPNEPSISYAGHSEPVLSVAWLDEKTVISVGVDKTIRLWNCSDASHLRTLDNHVDGVNDLALKPWPIQSEGEASVSPSKNEVLATISEDQTLRLWEPRRGRLLRFVRLSSTPRDIVWSADATQLIVGCNDGLVRFFDGENLEPIVEVPGSVGRIHELAIIDQGQRLLIAGQSGYTIHSLSPSPDSRQPIKN